MKIDFSGKSALVTGSTEGIGFAIAKGLAEAGADVVINGRTKAKVDAALARLTGKVRGRAVDLANAEGAAALVRDEPAFDIVVSNLGIYQPADFFEADDELWERHWQVNVMAGVRLARAYLRRWRRRAGAAFCFSALNRPSTFRPP